LVIFLFTIAGSPVSFPFPLGPFALPRRLPRSHSTQYIPAGRIESNIGGEVPVFFPPFVPLFPFQFYSPDYNIYLELQESEDFMIALWVSEFTGAAY